MTEILGRDVGTHTAAVGMGVHPFGGPTLADDFSGDTHRIDARQMHRYAVRWTPNDLAFYIDRQLVKVVRQSPNTPCSMLNIYDLGDAGIGRAEYVPNEFVVDYVHGHLAGDPNLAGTPRV